MRQPRLHAIVQSGMWSGLRVTGQRLGNLLADLDRSALVLPLGLDALTPTSWHARYPSVSGCGLSLLIHPTSALLGASQPSILAIRSPMLRVDRNRQVHRNSRYQIPGSLMK